MNFTEEQQRCINHLHGDLIVSAAAGSGKTAVLTERIIELVRTRRAGIDEMLVVTFTQAAAQELTHRIRARLLLARDEAPDDGQAMYLSRQIELMGAAQIGTVHKFCSRLLLRHFGAAGLDPMFRIADETECAAMMLEAAEEALEMAASEEGAAFYELFDAYGGRDGTELVELVQGLYKFTRSQPDIEAYLKKALEGYNGLSPEAAEILFTEAKRLLSKARLALQQARAAIAGLNGAPVAVLDDDLSRINTLRMVLGKADLDEFKRHLDEHKFLRMDFPKTKIFVFPENAKTEAQALRKSAKDCIKALIALFPHTLKEENAALAASKPAVEALFALLDIFTKLYDKKKAARGIVDFGDLEHKTLLALSEDAVAREYQTRFKFVFMDEYQDTNRVQNAILARLSRDNLFLVGDVKQSIYRFRLAEAELFMGRFERAGENGRAHLPHNFRSAKNVVYAINTVFSRIMSRGIGGVDYEGARLLSTREEDGPAAEFHFFDHDAQADDELEAVEREAVFAAQYIRERVGKPLYPGGKPLKYSDCAVLMRSTREASLLWARLFSLEGVPVRADAVGGIFDAVEVQVFRNLLRSIDNRRLDVPLLSVMRAIFAFTDAELATIRLNKGESVYDDVLAVSSGDGALADKCVNLVRSLGRWKQDARLMPVDELIGRLFTDTGYLSVISALPGGERRKSNLLTLKEHARANNPTSLFAFLHFLESLERAKRQLPGQFSGELEAVRILTIHGSKGLEFPLVIVAGLGRLFNFTNARKAVQPSKLGVAVKPVWPREGVSYDTLTKNAFKTLEEREILSDELRVLYVAMTRARDALVCCGTMRNVRQRAEEARTESPDEANCLLDWLLQVVAGDYDSKKLRTHLKYQAPRSSMHDCGTDEAFERFRNEALQADTSEVERTFSFKYPYQGATEAPSKLSVSELLRPEEFTLAPPAFLAEPTAADIGTMAHDILMRVDLAGACDEAALRELLNSLESAKTALPEVLDRVDINAISAFLNSSLGLRLRASVRIERESRFQLFIPAVMASAGYKGDNVLLQGVIDCCFVEDGAWVLLDYKTDYVSDEDYARAADKHLRQIELYAHALEELTGLRVVERYIHFLRHGESVRI